MTNILTAQNSFYSNPKKIPDVCYGTWEGPKRKLDNKSSLINISSKEQLKSCEVGSNEVFIKDKFFLKCDFHGHGINGPYFIEPLTETEKENFRTSKVVIPNEILSELDGLGVFDCPSSPSLMGFFNCKTGVLILFSWEEYPDWHIYYEKQQFNKTSGNVTIENENKSDVIINLYNQTNSTVYTSPGENSTCKLQADIDCSNPKDKNGRKVRIEFTGEKQGTFSPAEATTDVNGKAYFTYTAPNESALNGKNEITVQIKVTDVKSGKSSVIPVTILNRNVKSGFSVQNEIMPQGTQFYNELKIMINAPPKGDGYQATLTTKDATGLITTSKGDPQGNAPFNMKIKPGQQYTFYYHNTGSIIHSKPVEEVVTLDIPELKFKQSVNISVGIDLTITDIERKWKGSVYPGLPEPLEIYLADNFHPNSDIEKIFDDFDIKMRVRIEPGTISQSPVMSKYGEDYISRFITLFEGHLFGKNIVSSSGDAFVVPKKAPNGKYILCKNNREALPFVLMFDRGLYEFNAELIDINCKEPGSNNSGSISFNVEQYRDGVDEYMKTALIPMSKVLIDYMTGGLMAWGDVISATTDAALYEGAIKDGKLLDATIGLFGIFCGSVEGAKEIKNIITGKIEPVTEAMKDNIQRITLATNVLQLVTLVVNEKKGGSQRIAYSDITEKLKYPQLLLKGSKNHYVVVINKSGISNYSATLKNGSKLSNISGKLLNNSTEQRIEEDNEFIIIPCVNNEELNLNLNFNGTGGFLYRITKDKIDKIELPKNNSSEKISINSSVPLVFGKQITQNENHEEKKKENKSSLFSGSWETGEFGTISFVIAGSNVVGTCSKNLGGITGKLSSDGTKITGSWARFPTYSSPNDAGKIEITISKDGKSFSGMFSKGTDDKAKLNNALTGKKK